MAAPSTTQQPPQIPPSAAVQISAALAASTTVAGAMAMLGPMLAILHLRRAALAGAIAIIMAFPPARTGVVGPAGRVTEGLNLMRQAQFAVNAAWRINTAILQAQSQGTSQLAAYEQQLAAERRYYAQHQAAIWVRARAGVQVDVMAMTYGRLLGWYTVHDAKTSAECRAADRHNFYADAMPLIGYPGAVHMHCRCRPGRPVRGAALLPSLMQPASQKVAVYA